MKFLPPEVPLYKSAICPWMEYCCHVWAGVPNWYLELLDKLQKQICRTVVSSLAAFREPLAHCRNLAGLSLFFRYYFGRCSSELAQLVPLPFSRGRSTRYSDRLHDFSITIPRCYKNFDVNSFFPRTARSWNSLPIECFLLTYNLHSFRPRISRQLFFLVTPYLVVAVQLCMEWIPIEKKEWQKMDHNDKKFCHAPYLRNNTSYDCHLWYTFLKYLQAYFSFINFLFYFWGSLGPKRAKNGPKQQNILSVSFCILGTMHHMIVIFGTKVLNDGISWMVSPGIFILGF